MWIFLFAIEPIANTVTDSVTNAITHRGRDRFNSQRREQLDDDRLRTESNRCLCWRHGDVDEQRHCRAYIDGERRRLELRLGRSGCDLLENVLVCWHVPVSLHDPSGHGRNGQRPVERARACCFVLGRLLLRLPDNRQDTGIACRQFWRAFGDAQALCFLRHPAAEMIRRQVHDEFPTTRPIDGARSNVSGMNNSEQSGAEYPVTRRFSPS
jgi:hypothetical protein